MKDMTVICRTVDNERADCPNCGKSLTIRVLAYKHHAVCRAFTDRVTSRTAIAQASYRRKLRAATSVLSEEGATESSSGHSAGVDHRMDLESETTSESAPSIKGSERTYEEARQCATRSTYETTEQASTRTQLHEDSVGATGGLNKSFEAAARGTPGSQTAFRVTLPMTQQRHSFDYLIPAGMFHRPFGY